MPQPLKTGDTLQYHPRLVLDRPNHAAGIGLVVSEWAALEEELISVFRIALFAFSPHGQEASIVAKKAWDSMESIRCRLDFIEKVAEQKLSDDLFKQLQAINLEIGKRAKERNRVVHGVWQTSPEHPNDLILTSKNEDPLRYTVNDFYDIASRINETLNKVSTYWFTVRAQTETPVSPLPSNPA